MNFLRRLFGMKNQDNGAIQRESHNQEDVEKDFDESIEKRIRSIDWEQYVGPESYKPNRLINALINLKNYDDGTVKNGLVNEVLFSVGNNHAGTYYPAILDAIPLLIELAEKSDKKLVRNSSVAVLNDVYYFEPELGTYSSHTEEEISAFVKSTLYNYSDEIFKER